MPGLIVNGLNLSKWFQSGQVTWLTHSALSFRVEQVRACSVDRVAMRCTTRKQLDSVHKDRLGQRSVIGTGSISPYSLGSPSRSGSDSVAGYALGSYVIAPTVGPCGPPSTKRTSATPDCALYRSRRDRVVASDTPHNAHSVLSSEKNLQKSSFYL
jgi:hypothetical protein